MYFAYKKNVNALSRKHQLHFGINHGTSFLISTLVNIIFEIQKRYRNFRL